MSSCQGTVLAVEPSLGVVSHYLPFLIAQCLFSGFVLFLCLHGFLSLPSLTNISRSLSTLIKTVESLEIKTIALSLPGCTTWVNFLVWCGGCLGENRADLLFLPLAIPDFQLAVGKQSNCVLCMWLSCVSTFLSSAHCFNLLSDTFTHLTWTESFKPS